MVNSAVGDAAIDIKCVDSVAYDANGSKIASDIDGAVILAEVRKSDIEELRRERAVLFNRDIKLIGAAAYL